RRKRNRCRRKESDNRSHGRSVIRMKINVLSLFPAMFEGVFNQSMLKKAQEKEAVTFAVSDFREYADKKRQVDDYPFGGGAGMVLKPEPVFNAVEALAGDNKPRVILM